MPEAVSPIERLILEKLRRNGPMYANSFRHAKTVVFNLVGKGFVERVAGKDTTHKNALLLTAAGRRAIGAPPKGFRKLSVSEQEQPQ